MSSEQQMLDTQTAAVMKLAEQIAVNNNTVSSSMVLMSENLEESISLSERIEEKIDLLAVDMNKHEQDWDVDTCQKMKVLMKQIEETELLKYISRLKKIITTLAFALVIQAIIYFGKYAINIISAVQKMSGG